MRIVRSIAEVREAVAMARAAGGTVGLVPTMGAFHEGHLSLIRRARADDDLVVVSLFVNPTQFAANEDLGSYPRDEARDAALADEAGADILFAPPVDEVYPHVDTHVLPVPQRIGREAPRRHGVDGALVRQHRAPRRVFATRNYHRGHRRLGEITGVDAAVHQLHCHALPEATEDRHRHHPRPQHCPGCEPT